MSNPRGTKRICQSCGGKYYDLSAPEPTCPICNAKYNFEAMLKTRNSPQIVKTVRAPMPIIAPVQDDRLPPVVDEDDDEFPPASAEAVEVQDADLAEIDLLEVA